MVAVAIDEVAGGQEFGLKLNHGDSSALEDDLPGCNFYCTRGIWMQR